MITAEGKRMVGGRIGQEARRQGNLGKLDSIGWSEFRRLAPLEQERLLVGAWLEKILPHLEDMPRVDWEGRKNLWERARNELGEKVNAVNYLSCDNELKEKVWADWHAKERRIKEIDKEMRSLASRIDSNANGLPPGKILSVLGRLSTLVEEKLVLNEQVFRLGNAWRNLNGQNRHTTPSGY